MVRFIFLEDGACFHANGAVLLESGSTKQFFDNLDWHIYTAVTENMFFVIAGIVASPFFKKSDPNYPAKNYEKYRIELELE